MRIKLHHPLWTHLPAAVMVALMIVALVRVISLPEPLAVDPHTSESADRWEAAWSILGLILMSLSWVGIGVVWDEMWARSERRKRFRGWSLMDELFVGFTGAGMLSGILRGIGLGNDLPFSFSFLWFIPAATAAALLEWMRPFRSAIQELDVGDAAALAGDIAERVASDDRWSYWEMQRHSWMDVAMVLCVGLGVAAGLPWWHEGPRSVAVTLVLAIAWFIVLCVLCGGLRVSVTRKRVQLRMGILGLRVVSLQSRNITSVEVHEYSGLGQSGPVGVPLGGITKAHHYGAHRVVRVRTRQGKEYLIGSDHPERLAAVIGATLRATASTARTEK